MASSSAFLPSLGLGGQGSGLYVQWSVHFSAIEPVAASCYLASFAMALVAMPAAQRGQRQALLICSGGICARASLLTATLKHQQGAVVSAPSARLHWLALPQSGQSSVWLGCIFIYSVWQLGF